MDDTINICGCDTTNCSTVNLCVNKELQKIQVGLPTLGLPNFCGAASKCIDGQLLLISQGNILNLLPHFDDALFTILRNLPGYTSSGNIFLSLENNVFKWQTTLGNGYTDEQAQDAVGNILTSEFTYNDLLNTITLNVANGLSKNNRVQLGQTVGASGDPAKLLFNTEIPLGDFALILNNKSGIGTNRATIGFVTSNSTGSNVASVDLTAKNLISVDMSIDNSVGIMQTTYTGLNGNLLGSGGYTIVGTGGYFYLSNMLSNTTHTEVEVGGNPSQQWLVNGDTRIGLFGSKNTGFGGITNPVANVEVSPSTVTNIPLRIPSGVDPTGNYIDGSIWQTNNHLYGRLNGQNKQLDNDYNFTPDTFIQNQFALAQHLANFWIDGHGRIDDYLQINNAGRFVKAVDGILNVTSAASSSVGGSLRVKNLAFFDVMDTEITPVATAIYSQAGGFINMKAPSALFMESPQIALNQHTLFNMGGSYPLIFLGSNSDSLYVGPLETFLDIWNDGPAIGTQSATNNFLGFSANRVVSSVASSGFAYKKVYGRIGIIAVDYTEAGYKGDLVFQTTDAAVNSGSPTEYMRLKYNGNVIIKSLDTDSTAPTTTGTVRMVTCDNTGLLSFQAIPGGGGGGSVSSVGVASTDLSISGSPITTSGNITLNVANNAITYAKMQDVGGAKRLIGRGDSGTGDPQELTIGTGLDITGTVLSATPSGPQGLQNVITTDSNLTGNNTINAATHNLSFTNIVDYTLQATGTTFFKVAGYTSASDGDVYTLINHLTGEMGWSAGGGGGGVTSVSIGNLSPLFTSSIATATSTPAISFTLSNAAANSYLGNSTISAGAPSYTLAGALTKADDTNVTITLGGNPATSLLRAVSLTLGWTGQLAIGRGGTGLSALGTANQLIRVNAGATALEYFTPTFLTSALTSLNTLTATTQIFAIGTAGSDFGINSTTATHTFNLPDAGLSSRGVVTTSAQVFAGVKTFDVGIVVNDSAANSDFRIESTGNANAIFVDASANTVGIFNAAPAHALDITGNTRILSGSLAIGTAPTVSAALTVAGTGYSLNGVSLTPSVSALANSSPSVLGITGTLIKAGSGNHPIMAGLLVNPPTITAGLGTANDAASVFISGAPTTTVSGGTWALLIAGGNTKTTGDLYLGTGVVYSTGGYSLAVRNNTTGRIEVVEPDIVSLNSQTGTAYTLVIGDKGGMIRMNNAAANVVTVPTNASVPYTIGTQVLVLTEGAGQTTVAAAGGVTIVAADGANKLRVQNSVAVLIKLGTNLWSLSGDITT